MKRMPATPRSTEPLMCPICGEHPVQATRKVDLDVLADGRLVDAGGGDLVLYCENDCELGELTDTPNPSPFEVLGHVAGVGDTYREQHGPAAKR